MNKITNCIICGSKLIGKQTMYCSIKCKNKAHQSYDAQKERGIKRKIQLVKKFGGRCSICGYNKNLAGLTFHHTSEKKFKLDMRSLSNRTFAKVLLEVKKCKLVCQNCHARIHNPKLDF